MATERAPDRPGSLEKQDAHETLYAPGELSALERKIGYAFHDAALLRRALTHSSYANEVNQRQRENTAAETTGVQGRDIVPHNELMEFLGDSILGFVIAEMLFLKNPNEKEGRLSQKRAAVICEASLAACARELDIGGFLLLGDNMGGGVGRNPARRWDAILADVMEAIFAAVYLDGGIAEARRVILRCLERAIDGPMVQERAGDFKSRLQEHYFATDKNVKIEYTVIEQSGPAHNRRYKSQVAINGRIMGRGGGSTKKESEQNAAKEALETYVSEKN